MLPRERFWRSLLGAFYLPSALMAVGTGILAPILPLYASNLTEAYILIGVVLASHGLGTISGDIPASWVLRRLGIKRTMQIGITLSFLSMFALFFVENIPIAIALLLMMGVGYAFYNLPRHAYISIMIEQGVRGRAIGILGGAFRFGKFAGPLIGGFVGGAFGLNSAFLVVGAVGVMAWLAVERYLIVPDDTLAGAINPVHPPLLATFRQVLTIHRGIFMSAGLGQVLAQLTRQGWLVIVPLYGANVLDLGVQTIGLIMGVGSGMDLLLFYSGGFIMDRWGRKWAIVPSFTVQGTGLLLVLLTTDAIGLTLVAVLIGVANGTSSGTMTTLAADFAPGEGRGEFLSVWSLIGDIGFMAGPLVVGMVAQIFALQVSIATIGGVGWATAFLFGRFVPETLKKSGGT